MAMMERQLVRGSITRLAEWKEWTTLIGARDAVVWVNNETREVCVRANGRDWARIEGSQWRDPIGAAYSDWREANNDKRVLLMLETAIDLAMQGIDLGSILRAFAEVKEFRALGSVSTPMCRALTSAWSVNDDLVLRTDASSAARLFRRL